MQAVILALQLLVMIAVGVGIRKFNLTDKEFTSRLTTLVLQVCIPCLIFYSVAYPTTKNAEGITVPVEFSAEALSQYGIAIILGAASILLGLLVGQIFYWCSKDKNSGRIVRFGLTLCNFSFMGIPIMEALFGPGFLATYAFFLIPVRIGYYTLPEYLMTPPGSNSTKKSFLQVVKGIFLSPQLIAVILGLIFWIFGWKLPSFIDYAVNSLNKLSSPLALLLVGMLIAEYKFKQLLNVKYVLLPVLRCILMPALFFAVSLLMRRFGVSDELCRMFVIYGALPVPSLITVWTMKYDPNPDNHLMSVCTCTISMILCMLTIPIWNTLMA